MDVLYPQNPWMRKLPEPLFEAEYDAAREAGFNCLLFNEEAFSAGEAARAFAGLPDGTGQELLYRGWILTEEAYRGFHENLADRGYLLASTPEQYAAVTYFPNYYPKIRDVSPPAVWTDADDPYAAWSASRKLGDGPFVIKDHVKSAKHLWHEACFVPRGAGRESFEQIAGNLKAEQGKSFFRGFVIKQYLPLKLRGDGPRAYPTCEEYRLFFWKGRLLTASHYHRLPEQESDWASFLQVAQRFDSPFFTMDVAITDAGDWIVVDMGAGECSSLPPSMPATAFHQELGEAVGLRFH